MAVQVAVPILRRVQVQFKPVQVALIVPRPVPRLLAAREAREAEVARPAAQAAELHFLLKD